MPDYSTYTIEDLVRDSYFRRSVLHPDAESDEFWQSWAAAAPDRQERYEKARIMVITLHKRYGASLPREVVLHRIEQLTSQLNDEEIIEKRERPVRENYWWRAAAVLVVGLGLFWWNYTSTSDSVVSISEAQPAEEAVSSLITRINHTGHNQTFILSDSSIVTLSPGSTLQFPGDFTGATRQVTLTGDAFFEITPQANPFLVYAGETVTKVLGTRFRVTALAEEDAVSVSVKSGKVSVHRSSEFDLSESTVPGPGIVLTSHEQVVFNRVDHILEKAALTNLEVIAPNTDSMEQVFDDTPVNDVFRELVQRYGMEIEFDENVFASCRIITLFKDETLIERINSICQAIDATYEPIAGKVVISGNGCRVPTSDE